YVLQNATPAAAATRASAAAAGAAPGRRAAPHQGLRPRPRAGAAARGGGHGTCPRAAGCESRRGRALRPGGSAVRAGAAAPTRVESRPLTCAVDAAYYARSRSFRGVHETPGAYRTQWSGHTHPTGPRITGAPGGCIVSTVLTPRQQRC